MYVNPQEASKKIRELWRKREELLGQIEDVADAAMKSTGKRVPYRTRDTYQIVPDLYDEAQWLHITGEWDCAESPFGVCAYHKIHDPHHEACVFCKQPKDRR